MTPSPFEKFTAFAGAASFYLWNALMTCLTLVLLDTVPFLIRDSFWGPVPLDMAVTGVALLFIPPVSLVVGVWKWRSQPRTLGAFFYGLEAPVYVLLMARLMVLRELTLGVAHLLVLLFIGMGVIVWDLLNRAPPRTPLGHAVHVAGASLLALGGVWLGSLLVILWVPPAFSLAGEVLTSVLRGAWMDQIREARFIFFMALGTSLVFSTGAVLAALSFFLLVEYPRRWWRAVEDAEWLHPRAVMLALSAGVVVFQLGLTMVLHEQAQQKLGNLAGLSSATMSSAEFDARETELRNGLLAAYLAPYRYASDEKTADSLIRSDRMRAMPEAVQDLGVAALRMVASPFLYRGNRSTDPDFAAEAYERLFDAPIQKGEREAVLRALESTHDRREREASLMSVDQKKVHLVSQDIRVTPSGPLAEVVVTDGYRNQTAEQLEVFLLFTLPEAAVITGLWMGEDLQRLDTFQVATRGAAQRVYRREVQRGFDPALLEQVGPRQYRLRAFPIPPFRPDAYAGSLQAPVMHVRLSFVVPATAGGWPLPRVLEKRNAYWDDATVRTCNGGACPPMADDGWMPAVVGVAHDSAVPTAWWGPAGGPWVGVGPVGPAGKLPRQRIAVMVDTSHSMRAHKPQLERALATVRTLADHHDITVHLPANPISGSPARVMTAQEAAQPDAFPLMGHATADQLLQAHVALSGGTPHDAVFILTDAGAFDLTRQEGRARLPQGVLSMVHLGGVPAGAYDDATLQSVQRSGGSAFNTLEDAWAAYVQLKAHRARTMDGWAFVPLDAPPATPMASGPLASVLARQWVALQTQMGRTETVPQLEAVHAVARSVGMVTPYSSMLVLVSQAQRDALKAEETKEDRFKREVEQGNEGLAKPTNALATGAPEPEEWMMLLLTLGLFIVVMRR